ncbi:hypothetical protein M422DRAFT_250028 [Sphaerobolus stellatus SS14]|nr:hypothetical protein M422DRAFT_250028 [Sphaerobolus stellatus SS14]
MQKGGDLRGILTNHSGATSNYPRPNIQHYNPGAADATHSFPDDSMPHLLSQSDIVARPIGDSRQLQQGYIEEHPINFVDNLNLSQYTGSHNVVHSEGQIGADPDSHPITIPSETIYAPQHHDQAPNNYPPIIDSIHNSPSTSALGVTYNEQCRMPPSNTWPYWHQGFEDTIPPAPFERDTHFHQALSSQPSTHITQEWTSYTPTMTGLLSKPANAGVSDPQRDYSDARHVGCESIAKAVISYICDCGHETINQRNMHDHVYGDLRTFFCQICGYSFNQSEFEGHKREFPTGECGNSQHSESSTVQSNLTEHQIYRASQSEKFHCTCGKYPFKDKKTAERHAKTTGNDAPKWECFLCDMSIRKHQRIISRDDTMTKHLREKHHVHEKAHSTERR